MTPKPHERLASAIEARRGELGLALREVAQLAGITTETLRAVRRGTNEPSTLTKRALEKALHWTSGSVDAILNGGEPTPRERRIPIGQAVETNTVGTATAREDDDDPKMRRAEELLAEAAALLAEMRRERREGA